MVVDIQQYDVLQPILYKPEVVEEVVVVRLTPVRAADMVVETLGVMVAMGVEVVLPKVAKEALKALGELAEPVTVVLMVVLV